MTVERRSTSTDCAGDAGIASDSDAARRLLQRPLSDEELAAQTGEVARPLEEEAGARISLLLVECGGERLALPGAVVRRVTLPAVVHRVPHRSNKVLRGICNLGGQLVPTADLAALLELDGAGEEGDSPRRRMLLLGESPEQWAVEVDHVIGVVRIDPEGLLDPPATVRAARDHMTEHLVELAADSGTGHAERVAVLSGPRLLEGLARSLA
jgi:chemotaxis-related protein WspD